MKLNVIAVVCSVLTTIVGGVISYSHSISSIREMIAKNMVPRNEIVELVKTHAPIAKIDGEIGIIKDRLHNLELAQVRLQTEINTKLDFIMRDMGVSDKQVKDLVQKKK